MDDVAELFPDLDLGTPPMDGNGYAIRPVGRRRFAHARPRPRQRASTLRPIADLRLILDQRLGDIALSLKAIERHVQKQAEDQAAAAQHFDHLRIRMVALERHAAVRPVPEVPWTSRRRPLP
jgi:hypothetical protein